MVVFVGLVVVVVVRDIECFADYGYSLGVQPAALLGRRDNSTTRRS